MFQKIRQISPKVDLLYLSGVVVAFVALCASIIGRSSIWFDEAFGAYLIRFDFQKLTYYTGMDVHPPLYYYCLKLWSLLFGTTDVALRSMSVFFAVIALVVAFFFVRKVIGRRAAYVSLLFLAISPMFVRYSIEMRMYTLVIAIAVGAAYVLLRATQTNSRKWWALYAILLAAGMLTHYLVAVVWLAHWVWRLSITYQKPISAWKKAFFTKYWTLAHVFAVVLFLPWLPWLILRISDVQVNGFWVPPVSPGVLLDYVTNFLLYQNAVVVSSFATIAILFLGILALIKVPSISRAILKGRERHPFTLMLSLVIVPPALLIILSLPPLQSTFMDRYLLTSLFFTSIVLAVFLVRLYDTHQKIALGAGAIIIILAGIGVTNVAQYGNFNKMDNTSSQVRQLIEKIRQTGSSQQPIIADSPWLYYEASQYSKQDSQVYFIDQYTEYKYGSLEMLRENDLGKIKDLDAFLTEKNTVWYIGRPASNSLNPPSGNMTKVQSIYVKDRISDKPAYEATLFKLN